MTAIIIFLFFLFYLPNLLITSALKPWGTHGTHLSSHPAVPSPSASSLCHLPFLVLISISSRLKNNFSGTTISQSLTGLKLPVLIFLVLQPRKLSRCLTKSTTGKCILNSIPSCHLLLYLQLLFLSNIILKPVHFQTPVSISFYRLFLVLFQIQIYCTL